MSFSQPTGGRTLAVKTGLFLTVLVSVSLLGALAVEWGREYDRSAISILATMTPTPSIQPTHDSTVIRRRDFGLWGYVVTRGADGLVVDLNFHHETAQALKDYVAMNDEKAATLSHAGGMVDVLVTFRWPVKVGEFRRWVTARSLEAVLVSLRLSGTGGVPGTLTVAGSASDPLPQDKLDAGGRLLPPIEGVYSVRGSVPAGLLPEMLLDPSVFVADVTPTLTRMDMVTSGIPGAQDAPIHCESPFEDAAKWGLAHAGP